MDQFAIAWNGEAGEERRLGWWRTDQYSEFGGEDDFRPPSAPEMGMGHPPKSA